jgi:hypothetical protein
MSLPNNPAHNPWHPHPDFRREIDRCECGAIFWWGPIPAADGVEGGMSEHSPDCLAILRILPPSDLTDAEYARVYGGGGTR